MTPERLWLAAMTLWLCIQARESANHAVAYGRAYKVTQAEIDEAAKLPLGEIVTIIASNPTEAG